MADPRLCNLPDSLVERLRIRAARSGHSIEEEALFLPDAALRDAPAEPEAVQSFVRDLYGGDVPGGAVDELIGERRSAAEKE